MMRGKDLYLVLTCACTLLGIAQAQNVPPPHPLESAATSSTISGSSNADQSSLIQSYINALGKTGGMLNLPAGIIYAQGLSLLPNVILAGQSEQATTLMLPAGATSPYLVANSTYVNRQAWSSGYGGIRDLTLDGNKANNTKGVQALLIQQEILRLCRRTPEV